MNNNAKIEKTETKKYFVWYRAHATNAVNNKQVVFDNNIVIDFPIYWNFKDEHSLADLKNQCKMHFIKIVGDKMTMKDIYITICNIIWLPI